jgi:hypothetical protein
VGVFFRVGVNPKHPNMSKYDGWDNNAIQLYAYMIEKSQYILYTVVG